jgi:hypothetical protein
MTRRSIAGTGRLLPLWRVHSFDGIIRRFVAGLMFGPILLAAAEVPPASFWWEAETNGGEAHGALSGGRMVWQAPESRLEREVDIPASGVFTLWVRKFWNPQAFRWRVGKGPWNEVAAEAPLTDLIDLGPGRRVGWFNAGEVQLEAGRATFELEVTDPKNTTAYDCFVFTLGVFHPRGTLRPGERLTVEEPGWFAFEADSVVVADSPIDLRGLNEKEAGEEGFVVARQGGFFHSRTGRSVRFWGVNIGPAMLRRSDAELAAFARAMAGRGVNLVRMHGPMYEVSGPDFGRIDPDAVDRIHRMVEILKREGIYSSLSIYFPVWIRLGPENADFAGYSGGHPFALIYFHEGLQTVYRAWWNALLAQPNPRTGRALKDEPAVAMIELVNEDSLFFWTFNPDRGKDSHLPAPQRELLETRFGEWLQKRYPGKSLEEIRTKNWNGISTPQDDLSAGRVGFRPLWNIVRERTARDQDTVRFLADLQLRFYRESMDYVKSTLGYRGLVCASNWQTASARYLGPVEKWTNSFADFMDRHGYFGGPHSGEAATYAVRSGQTFQDRSALRFSSRDGQREDFDNPVFDITYAGQPSMISEINWPLPNRFRAEFPVLAATYGALHGTDAIVHFAASSPAWEGVPTKFSLQTPTQLGQYPATARIFRLGLMKTAPPVAKFQLSVDDLLDLKGMPLAAPENLDSLRARDVPSVRERDTVPGLDPRAFLLGGVHVDFRTGEPSRLEKADFTRSLNLSQKTAVSPTGEVRWDWGAGLLSLHAPAAQGAVGFLSAAGRIALPDVVLESPLEYGSILLVALDDRPIAASRRLLLQVMSEEKPHRWESVKQGDHQVIKHTGESPLLVRNLEGTVALKRPDAAALRISRLDAAGRLVGEAFSHGAGISLRPETFYYLIEATAPESNGGPPRR